MTADPNDRSYYPQCGCGWKLCHLDRTFDNCPNCGEEIPDEVKLGFDLLPLERTS